MEIQKEFNDLDAKTQRLILTAQSFELTEHDIYLRIARKTKDPQNRQILEKIADDELRHHDFWAEYTGRRVGKAYLLALFYYFIVRIFGLVFGFKLLERAEERAQVNYADLGKIVPGALELQKDEDRHEQELLNMIEEERLDYVGSMVLGLNDALVELTGALAGLTFAIQNPSIIAASGLITGIAASFSMAASEFLSKRADGEPNAGKSAIYTGLAYIVTVVLLILPYLLLSNPFISLPITLAIAALIILVFNYYLAVAKDLDFKKRFWEMFGISMGVAVFSFGIGFLVRIIFKVDI
ncbi:VIT1/CCC1 transporter family protein [Spirochaeta lutea]|uniref:Membrane protein n=1 Tax=Spirochaeta lutea TaxID=1480694 RepID=A0A098QUW3_9SPIO|nr:VIT1/CCC1 transporter family protein [Spirochaeta lutea]KGE71203.1 membrane protein [Spirochaeta lutea]